MEVHQSINAPISFSMCVYLHSLVVKMISNSIILLIRLTSTSNYCFYKKLFLWAVRWLICVICSQCLNIASDPCMNSVLSTWLLSFGVLFQSRIYLFLYWNVYCGFLSYIAFPLTFLPAFLDKCCISYN